MKHEGQQKGRVGILVSLGLMAVLAVAVLLAAGVGNPAGSGSLRPSSPLAASAGRLPELEGPMCPVMPVSASAEMMAALGLPAVANPADVDRQSDTLTRPPLRVVRDPFPTFAAVVLDKKNDEIILQDENLFQIMYYDRTTNTPPAASISEPKRVIGGAQTQMEFNCALYVDPNNGDVYSVNNDTLNRMTVFSRNVKGDTRPDRVLQTPHRTYGVGVDEANNELFMSVQDPPQVVVYNKNASGTEKPIRTIQGNKTGLADAHGLGLDTKNGWIFIANYGSAAQYGQRGGRGRAAEATGTDDAGNVVGEGGEGGGGGGGGLGMLPGSGKYYPPSITVYPIKAKGDVAPIRTIVGPKTRLNWPAHMYVDEANGDLYVANDGNDSILVFKITDEGDVAPTRVITGPKTEIKNPTGVVVDNIHDELIVANMGNHRATVYKRNVNGDVAPIRRIRAGPDGAPALQIGNPGAVAFDSKRDMILVPNCVAHPQIAIFGRNAKGGDAPDRVIFGQDTKLSRTMHDIRYSEKRDEIYVTNPFAQSILTFRGSADKQEAPIRIIQGPKTMLASQDTLEIDDVNGEILIPSSTQILIYPIDANGDVAPIRRPHRANPNPGWSIGGGIAVDPVHNIIATDGTFSGDLAKKYPHANPYAGGRDTIMMFDRTADGEVMPIRFIRGDRTGIFANRQLQIYPKGGWIIVSEITDGNIEIPKDTFVGVWSIYDSGDVPPRWKIPGSGGAMVLQKPRGVTFDAKHKEIIVSDMRLNAVLTFALPEMFDQVAKPIQ